MSTDLVAEIKLECLKMAERSIKPDCDPKIILQEAKKLASRILRDLAN